MFRLPIGLALSGGVAKGVTHIGVIKALREHGIKVSYIAGTSGGAIAGSGIAAGLSTERLIRLAHRLGWRRLVRFTIRRLGFISGEPIEAFIRESTNDARFEELEIPFAVVAADLVTGARRVFDSGKVAPAVRASSTMPQFFHPTVIDGRPYIDGGMVEFLPVRTVQTFGKQFTIAVNLAPKIEHYREPGNYFQLLMRVTTMMTRLNVHDSVDAADYVIQPELHEYSAYDFNNTDTFIKIGYQTTCNEIENIKAAIAQKNSLRQRLLGAN